MWGKKRVYLDYAAGVDGNPSSAHDEGRQAKEQLERARGEIARLIEVQPDDVLFTSGATESNALAILGHVRALRRAAGSDVPGRNNMHVLYLPTAHASVIENMKLLAEEGVTAEPLPVREYRVDTDVLATMLRKETVLVSMDAVCGEIGVVWNTREVSEVLQKSRGGAAAARIVLHVDASQAPWTEKITRDHFGADMLTFDGAKVGPMHGVGVLIAHRTIPLVPLYGGGSQERGLRPGTEAPELAGYFAAALSAAARGRDLFRAAALRDRALLRRLITSAIPDVIVHESRAQAHNIFNVSLPGRDTDYLLAILNEAGFAVSSRSACETDSQDGSRAVLVVTGDQEQARTTVRVSWAPGVTTRSLERFARAFAEAVAFIDNDKQG